MDPHFALPPDAPLPSLPIVTPDPPRKTTVERYGALFYLGIAGLCVLLALTGYFALGVWSLRDVWANVYTLHSSRRSEAERVQAAYALSRDPRVTQQECWDIALRKPLPPLARYLMAEAVRADAVAADPRGYTRVVARSAGWPGWLRVQLTRPLAYAAARGIALPGAPLAELRAADDPAVALWADFALAVVPHGAAEARGRIEQTARAAGTFRAFAGHLRDALDARGDARIAALDRATLWLRRHHPDCARVWRGWDIRDGRIARTPAVAPELH
jgi:hypothetical protein